MKITPDNLLQQELIGLKVEVEMSSNKNMIRLCGRVTDETRNMLVIEDKKEEEKKIAKISNTFVFLLEEKGVRVKVKGELLISRPEDRIRKK